MNIKAVMYHYVRDNEKEGTPKLNSLDIEDFKEQLDWLENNYTPLKHEDFINYLKGDFLDGEYFMLTFDDGLKDHYKYVYPELKKRGLIGYFFINSMVYTEQSPLSVQMVHFLIDKLGKDKFVQLLNDELKKIDYKKEDVVDDDIYRYDNKDFAAIKKLLNYELNYDIRDEILASIFYNFYKKENFINDIYLSKSEISEMISEGMIFGSHGHSHKVFSRLSDKEQYFELEHSKCFLEKEFKLENILFCYPYGHQRTFNDMTLKYIKKLGYKCAFSTIRGDIEISQDSYMLNRWDTIDLYPIKKEEG